MRSTEPKYECYCCGELFDDWTEMHRHEQDRTAHEGDPSRVTDPRERLT